MCHVQWLYNFMCIYREKSCITPYDGACASCFFSGSRGIPVIAGVVLPSRTHGSETECGNQKIILPPEKMISCIISLEYANLRRHLNLQNFWRHTRFRERGFLLI